MKVFLFAFFAILPGPVFGVNLYRQTGDLRLYRADATLTDLYEKEKEAVYKSLPRGTPLWKVSEKLGADFQKQNLRDLAAFHKNTQISSGDEIDAQQAFLALAHNPVAGHNPFRFYDENSGTGFCFGRALYVERFLESRKVSDSRLRKVFVVGELSDGNVIWDYHVATMYIDNHGRKLMIDTLFDEVYELDVCSKKMNKYALNQKSPVYRLYFADANKFQARSGFFQSSDVFNPIYSTYFFDLLVWL